MLPYIIIIFLAVAALVELGVIIAQAVKLSTTREQLTKLAEQLKTGRTGLTDAINKAGGG